MELAHATSFGANRVSPSLGTWLGDHADAVLSSNVGAVDLAFQRWFRFKEAYSPKLVLDVLASFDRPIGRCIDPTGGSGTTALVCSFLGIDCETIEVNPFLADLIEAKTMTYDVARLSEDMARLVGSAPSTADTDLAHAPTTLIEPGANGRWVFNRDVATRLLGFSQRIETELSAPHRPLFRILLGSVLKNVSNVVVNGKGRKYRRGWEGRTVTPDTVTAFLRQACRSAFRDIVRFSDQRQGHVIIRRGDARVLIEQSDNADCAIFSPPYPNSFDYTDIYNLELWMLGYLRVPGDNRALRLSTIHSHVQLGRRGRLPRHRSTTLDRVLACADANRASLWHRDIPAMLASYFADLECIVLGLRDRMPSAGGSIAIVVGASSYAGILVDTPQILEELAVDAGLIPCNRHALRAMRASAQQGGRQELSEDLLLFET